MAVLEHDVAAHRWAAPWWQRRLAPHVAALVAVLGLVLLFGQPGVSWTSDEGAYALQVRQLREGRWDLPHPAGELDPAGEWYPYGNSEPGRDGWIPFPKHPLHPLVLHATSAVLGRVVGLYVLSLAGVVLTAVAAWLVAGQVGVDRRGPPVAFWVAGLGPVFVHGTILWAHAPAAGLMGLALVCGLAVARTRWRLLPVLGLVVGVAGGILLRSEAVLGALALALGLALVARHRHGTRGAAALGGAVMALTVVTVAAETAWQRAVTGTPPGNLRVRTTGAETSYLVDRLVALERTVVGAAGGWPGEAAILTALVTVMAVVVGVLVWRLRASGDPRPVVMAAGTCGALLLARLAGSPGEPISGLVPTWPLAAVAVAGAAWCWSQPVVRGLVALCGVHTGLVAATQYRIAGGFEWGPRFLTPLAVPLAVLATAGLLGAADRAGDRGRRAVAAAGAVLVLVPAVVATAAVVHGRAGVARFEREVREAAAGMPAVVVNADLLARTFWSGDPLPWLLAPPGDEPEVLASLDRAGAAPVLVVALDGPGLPDRLGPGRVRDVTGPTTRSYRMRLLVVSPG